MVNAFIWYHGHSSNAEHYHAWLLYIAEELGIQGRLLMRKQANKTTFMEIFEDIDIVTIDKLTRLAEQHPCFEDIQRRSEVFEEYYP